MDWVWVSSVRVYTLDSGYLADPEATCTCVVVADYKKKKKVFQNAFSMMLNTS